MVLGHSQRERLTEDGTGFIAPTEPQQDFSQQDAWHHPVGLGRDAKPVVFHRFPRTAFRLERLREAEAEQLVLRLARGEGLELLEA